MNVTVQETSGAWKERQVDWFQLLFEECDFETEGERLFGHNPPNARSCLRLQEDLGCNLMVLPYDQRKTGKKIVVEDNGLWEKSLPLVKVVEEDGSAWSIQDYTYQDIVKMPIQIRVKNGISNERLLTLLAFYMLYPCRVERQKKRDNVDRLLNVLVQKMNKAG